MTPGMPFEQLVENWLAEEAPATVPANLHAAVIGRARLTRQRRRPALDRTWRRVISPARIAIDLAAVVVLAIAAFNLLGPRDAGIGSRASPSATSGPTEVPGPTPSPAQVDSYGEYLHGRHALTIDGITVSFSIDTPGWAPHDGFLISKWVHSIRAWHDGVMFWSAFPEGEKAASCLGLSDSDLSARDVAEAVAAAPGTELLSSPVDVTVGGRPAVYASVVVREAGGCDPGFVYRWQPQTGIAPWTETVPGDKIQVWVVEVDGRLLFIGALTRGEYMEPEIGSIVASMTFESEAATPSVAPFRELPLDVYGDYRLGRQFLAVDTFDFSVSIPAYRWKPYPNSRDNFLIAKRNDRSYGPSGLIFWAEFPAGDRAASCLGNGGGRNRTALGVAEAIAAAAGTTLETPPTELTVGGRPAAHVSVVVGDDTGCDPAFVYGWQPQTAGVPWYQTAPGDTVRAWIVEVDDRLLFIGALTRGPTYGDAYLPGLESEIESIVDSLRFE